MTGARYVWLLPDDYTHDWWRVDDSSPLTSCSNSRMRAALQGHITTDLLPLSTSADTTISGMVRACNM